MPASNGTNLLRSRRDRRHKPTDLHLSIRSYTLGNRVGKLGMKRTLIVALLLAPLFTFGAQATHDPNDFFVTETVLGGDPWNDLWGTSTTNLYALSDGPPDRIAVRTGGVWAFETLPAGVSNVGNIWVGPTTVHAGASNLGHLKKSGGTWTTTTVPGLGLVNLVAGNSDTDVMLFDSGSTTTPGMVSHWDGAAYTTAVACGSVSFGLGPRLVFGTGTGYELYLSTSLATVTLFTFASPWTSCVQTTTSHALPLLSYFRASTGATWGAGGTSTPPGAESIARRVDPTFSVEVAPEDSPLRSVHGVSATDKWAVGDGGTIIHSAAATEGWTVEPSTTGADLLSVFCVTSTECWAGGEGGIIQKLQINPVVAAPTLTGLTLDSQDIRTMVSHAQCLGDDITYSVGIDKALGAGGLHGYIIDATGGTVVLHHDSTLAGDYSTLNNVLFWRTVSLPAGDYLLVNTADYSGILEQDEYSFESFNVPKGSCVDSPTDLSQVLNHIQYNQAQENTTQDHLNDTDNNVTHLHAELHNQFTFTNSRINQTHLSIIFQVNQAWARLNTTCQKTAFSAVGCEGVENLCSEGGCNITVDNSDVINALGETEMKFIGLDTAESWTLVLLGGLFLWGLRKNHLWVVAGTAIAIPAVIFVGNKSLPWAVLVLMAGLIIQYFATGFRSIEEQGAKTT